MRGVHTSLSAALFVGYCRCDLNVVVEHGALVPSIACAQRAMICSRAKEPAQVVCGLRFDRLIVTVTIYDTNMPGRDCIPGCIPAHTITL